MFKCLLNLFINTRISNFGLLEMSRQRLRESAVKWKINLTDESFALKLLKLVELKAVINKAKFVEIKVCRKISDFLKDNFIDDLSYFEKKIKLKSILLQIIIL